MTGGIISCNSAGFGQSQSTIIGSGSSSTLSIPLQLFPSANGTLPCSLTISIAKQKYWNNTMMTSSQNLSVIAYYGCFSRASEAYLVASQAAWETNPNLLSTISNAFGVSISAYQEQSQNPPRIFESTMTVTLTNGGNNSGIFVASISCPQAAPFNFSSFPNCTLAANASCNITVLRILSWLLY